MCREGGPTKDVRSSAASVDWAPILAFACVAVVLTACGDETGSSSTSPAGTTADGISPSPTRSYTADTFPEGTIPDVLATDGRFITILRILDLHDSALLSFMTISHETGTFFAPTEEAFADLPSETVDALLEITNNPTARAVIRPAIEGLRDRTPRPGR